MTRHAMPAGLPAGAAADAAWDHRFRQLLRRCVGAERCNCLAPRFLAGVGEDYRSRVAAGAAVRDCLRIDALSAEVPDVLDLRGPRRGDPRYHLQWASRRERPLDRCLPLLQHLGLEVLDQIQYVVDAGRGITYLKSFTVASRVGPLLPARARLLDTLRALLQGRAADDMLNALVLSAGLRWREADLLRAYCRYAGQLGGPLRRQRAERALIGNAAVSRLLFRYFAARFDPGAGPPDPQPREEILLEPVRLELAEALNAIGEVTDDRALRDLFNLIDATLRTNFYLRSGSLDVPLALKIDALGVIEMAAPRPAYEIYVHAADLEGIHLRGAKVARGGIRWSDRSDDLRSEILDLQQTQMIKNALIVPQGAKGGFVLKRPPDDPETVFDQGRRAYRRFIGGLLDVTDRTSGGGGSANPAVLCYDEPDPYLVVAADKGTAGFSDTANEIAERYGFWLGDAFASGGSRGYSHKRFGITARGAWECLRRHFREMDRDIDRDPISVVGVGSMDGDVFGNGMLLSRHLRLLGAFSAQHIFLDPAPEPEQSFRERQRLFQLPGSTWDCYDRALISPGGGVFSRAAKRIRLSPAVQAWLGVRHELVDGEQLVRLLLTAPADLLWFGGIGTYVKHSEERSEQVGDPGNDAVRVDASELRAKVVGEGANLAMTQRARVEYALRGGRINMDALDNSAGVDLSDHEVNLKILLHQWSADGLIAGREQRDVLMGELADQVCASVLAHNRTQSFCVSLDAARCRRSPEDFLVLVRRLANFGWLDGEPAQLPDRRELLARPGQSLTRPELIVLLARTKLALKSVLSADRGVLDPAGFGDLYGSYFPQPLLRAYGAHLDKHPLAHEIMVSQIANTVIDRAGATFLTWIEEPTPALLARAVTLYRLFDRMLHGQEVWDGIQRSAPNHAEESALLLAFEDALATLCRWGLGHSRRVVLDEATIRRWRSDWNHYREAVDRIQSEPAPEGPPGNQEDAHRSLIRWLSRSEQVEQFPYVVDLKRQAGCAIDDAYRFYLGTASWFGWPEIAAFLAPLRMAYRARLAHRAIGERFRGSFLRLSLGAMDASARDPRSFLENLLRRGRLMRVARLRRELAAAPPADTLEILVLLAADAEAAAVDWAGPLQDL